jgi:hypothetical protein
MTGKKLELVQEIHYKRKAMNEGIRLHIFPIPLGLCVVTEIILLSFATPLR